MFECQRYSDEQQMLQRQKSHEMDMSVHFQRNLVYKFRKSLLHQDNINFDIEANMRDEFHRFYRSCESISMNNLKLYISDNLSYTHNIKFNELNLNDEDKVVDYLWKVAQAELKSKEVFF
nr:hypothetical protein [Limosilactobacillus equigenerosi]